MRDARGRPLALALGGALLFFAVGCGGGGDDSSSSSDKSAPDASFDAAAQRFLDSYVHDDGRVQRVDQGGDTVGEGQAYGMLIAAAIGDEQRFDPIWDWTKDNIQRPDGLISFLWRDGKVEDPEAASDADVDAARALLVASCRFKQPGYKQEALDLGKAILDNETADVPGLAGARRRPVGPQGPDHAQPELLLAGHVRGAGRGDRRRPVGQPLGERAIGHRPADAERGPPAARLGGHREGQARADRRARPDRRRGASASTPRARSCASPRTPTRPGSGSPPGRGPPSRARSPPTSRSSTT